MAKRSNQKLKLLHLQEVLLKRTDEEHPMTIKEIQQALEHNDIVAERKSLYDDIEALRSFGVDVNMKTGRGGYYIGERHFELPELKLLVDSVQASKFITEKKTISLIQKLMALTSVHEAKQLQRQVYVHNRIKSMNESIYYNVDTIHTSIAEDKQICFRYFEYDKNKRKKYRRNGELYHISPFALTWDDENYYMIGYDAQANILKHYRVDKMDKISVSDRERMGKEVFRDMDMAVYTRRTFGMYGGEEKQVTLQFENNMIGVMMDKFGKDIVVRTVDDMHSVAMVSVAISPQFYGWVFGLAGHVKIVGPQEAVDGFRAQLENNLQNY